MKSFKIRVCSLWPAFVPVHVPARRAYIGIQNMGTVFTRRFEADLIGSQVPVKLMHLEGLYELFVSKFVSFTPCCIPFLLVYILFYCFTFAVTLFCSCNHHFAWWI